MERNIWTLYVYDFNDKISIKKQKRNDKVYSRLLTATTTTTTTTIAGECTQYIFQIVKVGKNNLKRFYFSIDYIIFISG